MPASPTIKAITFPRADHRNLTKPPVVHIVETFPLIYCLNLARRQDRRVDCEEVFSRSGISVRRFPAIDCRYIHNKRRYESRGRYAHALGLRLILRDARMRRAPAVMIFEDDVEIDPDIHQKLKDIELPNDWGMFYLGGLHCERPEVIRRSLIKSNGMLSTHAFGVRDIYYNDLINSLNRRSTQDNIVPAADVVLARLHQEIPTYSVFPNLAWQRPDFSDLSKGEYQIAPYSQNGHQQWLTEVLAGVAAEVLGKTPYAPAAKYASSLKSWIRFGPLPKTFNFKSEGRPDSLRQNPQPTGLALILEGASEPATWNGYLDNAKGAVSVYRYKRCNRITERVLALREALSDPRLGFFIFLPSDCIPIRPISDLQRFLSLSGSSFTWDRDKVDYLDHCRLVHEHLRFHLPWIAINRKVAELIVEDDFAPHFVDSGDARWCYEASVLSLKGYPLEKNILPTDIFDGKMIPLSSSLTLESIAALLLSRGKFFTSNIPKLRQFGLHK